MLRTAVCLAVLLCWSAPSQAEVRQTIRRVRLPLQSTTGLPANADLLGLGSRLEEAHARSAAAMDAFDRKIARRARRAVTSICDGCSPGSPAKTPVLPHLETNALPEGEIVDDPAQAPID